MHDRVMDEGCVLSSLSRTAVTPDVRSAAGNGVTGFIERPMPLPERIGWLVDVIGQMCEGNLYLIGGPPGSMKSRLITQFAVELARSGDQVSFLLT